MASQCASCHTGSYPPAVSKPANATHASVTGNCESCHKSTASWATVMPASPTTPLPLDEDALARAYDKRGRQMAFTSG